MTKLRVAAVLGLTMTAVVISASPATALFSGTSGSAAGGPTTWSYPGGILKCEEMLITEYKQVKEGGEDHVIVTTYKGCVLDYGPGKTTEPGNVSCEEIDFESSAKEGEKEGKATAKLPAECHVKGEVSGCEIKVPSEGNQKLGKAALKKNELGVLTVVELSGITINPSAKCQTLGLKSNKETKLSIPKLMQFGLGLI